MTPPHLSILYEDDALLVVHKPIKVVIHHGLPQAEQVLVDLVKAQCGFAVTPVHRLDRGTSGVIVLAKDKEVVPTLNQAFASREVSKDYLALSREGWEQEGTLTTPLTRRAREHKRPKAKTYPSTTGYRLLEEQGGFALLMMTPETGRQHQIRRHMAAAKRPILGDSRYGHKRQNRQLRIDVSLHRMALHALRLQLRHPLTEEAMCFLAPLPEDLSHPLSRLGFQCHEAPEALFSA